MKLKSVVFIPILLLLTLSGFAQDGIRVVRGTVNTVNGGTLSQVRITTKIGNEFTLDGGGYFEIRIPSQCKTLVFKANNYLPVTKIVDGSYLTVSFIPMLGQQTSAESSHKDKPQEPENYTIDKKQKKLQARIQSCYDKIDEVRSRLSICDNVEDLKGLFLDAVKIRDMAYEIDDDELKSAASQLLEDLDKFNKGGNLANTVNQKSNKLQASVQSCYNRIDEVRSKITQGGKIEDLTDLFLEAEEIKSEAIELGDKELKSAVNQLLVDLNEKKKIDQKQKKLQARIQSCYNKIDGIRSRVAHSSNLEDIKDLFQEAVDIRTSAYDLGDKDLISAANQLLVDLNEKRKALTSL